MSNVATETVDWLTDPANWSGSAGIPVRLAEHLLYTGLVMLIATAIAVPIGLYVATPAAGGWPSWPSPARSVPCPPSGCSPCSSCSPASG